jgi:HEAT repeat protein
MSTELNNTFFEPDLSKATWRDSSKFVGECVAAGAAAVEPLVSALKSLASSRSNAEARGVLIYALGKIRDKRAVNAIIECLLDNYEPPESNEIYRVGSIAIDALGMIGDTEAVESLTAILSNDKVHWEERCRVLEAIGNIDDPRAVKAINIARTDKNEHVRKTAEKVVWKLRATKEVVKTPAVDTQKKKWWQFWM